MPGAEAAAAGSSWAGPVAAAAAVGSLASGLFSNSTNKKIAQQNIDFQREVNAQNERLMREAWARDDSSRQRMVADLEAAGLSKWLATGASPSSTSPISLGAPQNDYKPDYSMFADAAQHAYSNFLTSQQTEKQNEILDKQAKVIDEDIAIKEAEKRIKQNDAEILTARKDVASTDPAYMKMATEALNILLGQDREGVGKKVQNRIISNAKKTSGATLGYIKTGVKAAGKGLKTAKDSVVNLIQSRSKGVTEQKPAEPLSFSDWLKTNQLHGSQQSAKLYSEYKNNFYRSRR